jgi:hypothetical protein
MLRHQTCAAAVAIGLAGALLLGAGSAIAQPDIYYSSGAVSFHYEQTFPGPYSGDFSAEGPDLNLFAQFRPGQTEAVGGDIFHEPDDTTSAVAYALVDNEDGTVDAALILVRAEGEVTPGTYTIDTEGFTVQFAFIDDIAEFNPPPDPDLAEMLAWLEQVPAAYKFIGFSGTIVLTQVDVDGFSGSFSGVMVDPAELMLIDVENGVFALNPSGPVAVPAAGAGVRLTVGPNPFNPQTAVNLRLPAAQAVTVTVHDLAGRAVRQLYDGSLAAGEHRWVWDGRGSSGGVAAAGVYLIRARAPRWQRTAKAILLP